MVSDAKRAAQIEKGTGKFYGWRNVVLLGLIFFVTMALVLNTANIANTYMMLDESMNMNATLLGIGFTVYILLQGWAAPLIGRIGQRLGGFKRIFIIGTATIAVCAAICAFFMSSAVTYIIVFGVFMSIAVGFAGQVPTDATISYWFKRKRGMAMGIIMGFSGLAAIVGPPIIQWFITAFDTWRAGWWFLIGCSVICCILACFLYTKPEDYGQVPYGDREAEQKKKAIRIYQRKVGEGMSMKQGLTSVNTWLIMIGGGAAQFTYTFTTSFGMLHFMNLGFAAIMITAAISARGVGSSLGGLIPGFLSDRIEPIYLQGIHMLLVGIFFVLAASTGSEVIMFCYFFFTGWAIGAQKGLCPTALANWTGTENFARIYGYTLLVLATLAAIIPTAVGMLYDATGTYSPAVMTVGVIAVICGIACFLVRFPKKGVEHRALEADEVASEDASLTGEADAAIPVAAEDAAETHRVQEEVK